MISLVIIMNDISSRLLEAVRKSGYSYGELSKLTGIPKSALQRYATGETEKIPIDRLQVLAPVLKTTAEAILGWEAKEKPEIPEGLYEIAMQSVEEQRLLMLWRKADGIDKQTIWNILSRYEEEAAERSSTG